MASPSEHLINPQRRHRSRRDPNQPKKHSFLGVMACGLAMLGLTLSLVAVPFKGVDGAASTLILVLLVSSVCGMCAVGVGLSIAGIASGRRKRVLPMIGLAINPVVIVFLATYLWWPTAHTLVTAASSGDAETVRKALELGVDIDKRAGIVLGGIERNLTALETAADGGWVEVVDLLLDQDADANTIDNDGRTPLYHAVIAGQHEAVSMLLKAGADPNLGDSSDTPLYRAAGAGRWQMVSLLMDHGADVNGGEANPLVGAAENGHTRIIDLLLDRGAQVNAQNSDGNTALHLAAMNGYGHTITKLLRFGADVNALNHHNETPLEIAVLHERDDTVQQLVLSGAEVDVFTAVGLGDTVKLRQQLEKDPSQAAATRRNRSPLHLAAQRGAYDAARVLLEYGGDVNARTSLETGETPLFLAVTNGHADLVELLLENGADLDMAIKADKALAPVLYFAVVSGQKQIVEMLLEHGGDVNAHCDTNRVDGPPLFFAVHHNHDEVVQLLVAHRADIDGRTNNASPTPLYEAVARGNMEIVEFLLENGADPNAQVVARASPDPLSLAKERMSRSPWIYNRVAMMLRNYGARD